MRKGLASLVMTLLAGCSAVGPDYVAQPPAVSDRFVNARPAATSVPVDASAYWASFSDPALVRLVDQALAANLDVRIAMANLREARAFRSEVRGGLFPTVDARASATRNRASAAQLPGTTIDQRTQSSIDVGVDAGWEIDLFGGVRRSVEAATAQRDAVEADAGAVRIAVSTETARQYITYRGLQRRLRVAQDNLANQQDTLRVISARFDAGRGTDFDVARAKGLVETTRAGIPPLQAELARTSYALAVLTGQQPGALAASLEEAGAARIAFPNFAVEDPATLLRQRPDVVAAERRLAAATAAIGVNTAALFPSVTLIGSVGVNATRGADLSKGDAVRYAVGPTLSWNLLDFGRIRSRIEQADARHEGALAAYEKTVLTALADAEGALVTADRLARQAEAVAAAADAARTAARLATLRFQAGATDLLDLLDAQRQVLGAEDQLSVVETARAVASISLFKAMGGAWRQAVAVPG